jgi:hypothetical protein
LFLQMLAMFRRLPLIPLVLLLLAATAVRLYHIQTQSIWFDEGWSAYAAVQPTLLDAWNADATNPPLYYVLLNIAARGFGTSELALRFFSTLWGLLAVALSYRLGRDLFGARAGVWGATIATFLPLLWWASQEARMYTLLACLVLICALAWHRLRIGRTAWAALLLGELALLYAHNTGPVVVIWLNAVTLVGWIIDALTPRRPSKLHLQGGTRDRFHPAIVPWILGQVVVGGLWLPYFLSRFVLLSEANAAVSSAPTLSLDFFARLWGALWIAPWERLTAPLGLAALIAGVPLLAISLWRGRANGGWLALHAALLAFGVVIGLIFLGNEFHGRYLVMAAPLVAVLLGVGTAALRPAALCALLLAGLVELLGFHQLNFFPRDDARGMVQYYADTLDADDTVLAWSYADRYDLWYYWERLGVKARRVTLPEGADVDRIRPLLPDAGDVALNVWYTQRADYRGMMHCLLSHGTRTPPEQHTVYGMTNLLFHASPLTPPEMQPLDIMYTGNGQNVLRVESAGMFPTGTADQAVCVPVIARLFPHDLGEFKALISVQNALGWEIARADAVFADAAQRTTFAGVSQPFTAYPLLRLPLGTPPGEYRVFLRVYNELPAYQSGFQPDAPQAIGRDLPLGVWHVTVSDWLSYPEADRIEGRVDLPISGGLTLVAHNQGDVPTLRNGDEIRLALLWRGAPLPPALLLADTEGRWQVDIPYGGAYSEPVERLELDWRSVRIPANAESGAAELRLPDGTVISRYIIDALPLITEPPAVEDVIGVAFPGVGELVGYTLGDVRLDAPPALTLLWRAGETAPSIPYTVFAQLINDDGRVVAQSDAYPGGRPTTGWRAGEYIEDIHTLSWNEAAAPGEMTLIVGLYDASTGARLRLADGTDAATLGRVTVE